MKYLFAAILACVATFATASEFSSASQFRQCGRTFNDLESRQARLSSGIEQRDQLQASIRQLDTQIETFMRPFANDYNSRQRLQAAILQFNAMVAESNNQLRALQSQERRLNSAVDDYNSSCGENTISRNSDIWKEVCSGSSDYRSYCQSFQENR